MEGGDEKAGAPSTSMERFGSGKTKHALVLSMAYG
jgi:hypothetical protein